jgi:hypothetical protein
VRNVFPHRQGQLQDAITRRRDAWQRVDFFIDRMGPLSLLDGVFTRDTQGGPPVFHPARPLSQAEVEAVVKKEAMRIVRLLHKRGLITLATAPGDDEVTVMVGDETLGEDDPLLAQLLAAAIAGLPPAGPAQRRPPVRLALSANAQPKPKGRLCAEHWGFNLHAATRVHGNDRRGREHLCRHPAPTSGKRAPSHTARRQSATGFQAPLVRWHKVHRA